MRQIALLLSLSPLFALSFGTALGQSNAVTSHRAVGDAYCPSCGRVHAQTSVGTLTHTSIPASPSSSTTTSASSPVRTSGSSNVLGILNGQRSRQGLRTLRYDSVLQAVAERRVRRMASMGLKGHPSGSIAPGRYEGVGWCSSFTPNGVYACYTSDPRMTAAGAAMVSGRDGVYFAVVYR